MSLTRPTQIYRAFAENGDRNTIPDTSATDYRASFLQGFPSKTEMPVGQGGTPPDRRDFNGIFYDLSKFALYQQSGGAFEWSALLDYLPRCEIYGSDGARYVATDESGPGTSAGAKDPTQDTTGAYWKLSGIDAPIWTSLFFETGAAVPVRTSIPMDRSRASIASFDSGVTTTGAVVSAKLTFGTTTLSIPRFPATVDISALRGKSVTFTLSGVPSYPDGVGALLRLD